MTVGVKIQLLGGFQITEGGEVISGFTNTRLQSVLAYLILSRNAPQARQQLAYLFWPDSSDSQARTNLRNILHLLRNHLPDVHSTLLIDSTTVQWRQDAPIAVDIVHFDEAIELAQQAQDENVRRKALDAAAEYYIGDLLPNCYDEWILSVREEWQQRYLSAVEELIDLLDRQREYRSALTHAQRLLQYDPLLETTYARLMQLHAALGDRAAALRVYHLCRTTLDRELGVEPSPTTQAIYERLLNLEAPVTPVETLRLATPLVGREDVWGELQRDWQRLLQGGEEQKRVQFVMLTGEAGIGKTRLAEELVVAVGRQGARTATAYCYPAGGRLAYAPLQSWLRSPQISPHRGELATIWQEELTRLLPELASDTQQDRVPSPVTDAANRRRLFEAVLHALTAGTTPLLLTLDDIQWCDRDTLEWIEFLLHSQLQRPLKQPILLLATLRSGENSPEDALSAFRLTLERVGILHDLNLDRLTEAETSQLVENLTGKQPANRAAFYQETDGIPLFIIETMRASHQREGTNEPTQRTSVTDDNSSDTMTGTATTGTTTTGTATTGTTTTSVEPLPTKILSVIEGRLVRLSPEARTLADLAAVVGRAFTTNLLVQATTMGEDELVQGLDELWQQQIIKEHAGRVEETYVFVHDKLREVLYGLLSPMRRRLSHRRVAQALEDVGKARQHDVSTQVALHYEQAGQLLTAIEWLQRAAHSAHRLSALQDALDHLQHALELLQLLGDEVDPAQRGAIELPIQMQCGAIYLATKGYAAPEVEQALMRASALCAVGGTVEQRFAVLYGLGRYYLVRPDLDKGVAVSQQLLQLAEASNNSDLLVEAYTTMGTYLLHRAELPEALDYLQRAITLYDQETHGTHTVRFGQDPGVVSLSYGAWTHWCLGEIEQAKQKTAQALALADALGYPYNQAIAQTYAAAQWQYLGDADACLREAEKASKLATEQGFVLWQAMADFLRGWSCAHLGRAEKGLALMQASANLFRATGAELGACYFGALLAETMAREGEMAAALDAIAEAFELLERTQDRWCAPELHRIHGVLLLQQAKDNTEINKLPFKVGAAKAAFTTGHQIAQEQGAIWWQKRCQESLAMVSNRR